MLTSAVIVAAVVFDMALGEPRRWHPLVGFGRWANWLERTFYRPSIFRGMLIVVLAVAPIVLLAIGFNSLLSTLFSILILWITLGFRSLTEHGERVFTALDAGKLDDARHHVSMIVSRNTENMNESDISRAAIESLLENGNDAVFGTIFWFILLGVPGAVLYRLINTLDAMWGYRNPRYLLFGRFAARLDDLLNYLPARLTATSYAIAALLSSRFHQAWRSWQRDGTQWESPNAGPVMAAGAGALGLRLGGAAMYHGQHKERPSLGSGRPAAAKDIAATLRLLKYSLMIWLLTIILIDGALSLA